MLTELANIFLCQLAMLKESPFSLISVLDVRTLLVNSYGSGVVHTINVSSAINVAS